jgi:hypothetical protein
MYITQYYFCPEAYTSSTHLQKELDFEMYVSHNIQFCWKCIQFQHIYKWINIHNMEYYFQWQVSQYSDSLEAVPYAFCFLAEARDFPSIQNIRSALGTSGLLFRGCCGSFPSVEAADA